MTGFSDAELDYMAASSGDRQEGRLKITGREGNFRIVPVRVAYDPGDGTIEIAAPEALHVGINLPPDDEGAYVELVIEDLATIEPWQPRGIAVTGAAEALSGPPRIRIAPQAVRSWGLAAD